jgi:hypothetical protein
MAHRAVLVLALLVAAPACTYTVNRAAFVPHATPLTQTGQPMHSTGELTLGAVNAADAKAPTFGDPSAAVEVPGTQLHGGLALRASKNVSIAAIYERGLASTATRVKTTQPPVDGGDVDGYGASITYSVPTSKPGFRIGITTELLFWSIPWIEYRTCIDCAGPYSYVDQGRDVVPTLALGVTPSYHAGRFTWFGGLTTRNHPTITQKGIETGADTGGDVQSGPLNVVAHVGAEVELAAGVRASLIVDQTLTRDPVVYGPGFGLLVTIPLGRDPVRPPAPPPAAAPVLPPPGPPGATPPL